MVETLDLDIFSRNSRKHRRLDDDPLDDGEIWPASAIPPPSYKDSLMKDNVAAIHTADEIFDDEEIEIQEGDEFCPDLLPKPDCVAAAEVHDTVKPSDTSPSADSCTIDSFGPWMLAERRP
ncbi:hypothetical protein V6N13_113565 [Hibiscus sabdariffa]